MGLSLGAYDYMVKPINRNQLLGTLAKLRFNPEGSSVLVVEDDDDTRTLISRTLIKAGWTVEEARNGRSALDTLASHSPDIILLDLMMPKMNGFEFVQETLKDDRWKAIPIIVMTAKDITEEDRLRLNRYVMQIVQKADFDPEALLAEVRRLTNAYAQRNQHKS